MADKNSGWACTHSASIVAEDNAGVTIRVICYWKNQGWRYDMNGVSAWVYCAGQEYCVKSSSSIDTTGDNQGSYEMGRHDFYIAKTTAGQSISCYAKITSTSSYVSGTKSSGSSSVGVAAKPSYTVSYNANGGSGAPGNQTKWYNENLTLSSTTPTRAGHNFVRWNGGSHGYYTPGSTYSGNANMTLTAEWSPHTYQVTYNANGGSGAPGAQTKTYGVNLTLSSTKPTRTNYNFKGWSTSAGGSVVYAAGATYTNNSAVTLYAVWELAYTKPRITNLTANRCTSNGTISETGTYIKVTFNWATDRNQTCINIDWKAQSASSWTVLSAGASGTTSGSVSKVIGDGAASIETSYYVRIYVEDGGGNTLSGQVSVGTVKFPIDVKSGGKGVAIGKVAETENLFDVGWKTRIRGDLVVDGNSYANAKLVAYVGSDTAGTNGWYKVASQTMNDYGNTNILYYIKAGYNSGYVGLLDVEIRCHSTSVEIWECKWLVRHGFDRNDVRIVVNGMTWTLYVHNPSYQYGRVTFSEIQHLGIGHYKQFPITYYNSTTRESTAPTATKEATEYIGFKSANGKTHTGYGNHNNYVPDISFLSYWNGAYDSNNSSNLHYCAKGGIRGNSYAEIYWGRQTVSCTSWESRSFGNVSSSSASGRFSISGNNVVVGAGVSKVKITVYSVGYHPGSGGDRVTNIKVGSVNYDVNYTSAGSSWGAGGSGSMIASVSNGSTITATMTSGITQNVEHLGARLVVEDIT